MNAAQCYRRIEKDVSRADGLVSHNVRLVAHDSISKKVRLNTLSQVHLKVCSSTTRRIYTAAHFSVSAIPAVLRTYGRLR
jgi:hypothetical protein